MSENWDLLCSLFERCRPLSSEEREAVLAAHAELRDEVEALLRHHDVTQSPVATGAAATPPATAGVPEAPTAIGPWHIDRVLGVGGMGSVYLGVQGEVRAALKVLHPHLRSESSFYDRFRREGEIGARIQHEGVVRTIGMIGEDCIAMEFVEGQTLDAVLDEQGPLPEALVRYIGKELARALVAVHEAGVIHRDIKPSNVLITPEQRVKLMDLGVALPRGELLRLSQTGQFVGTVRYAAPEQFAGKEEDIDGRADLYALGLLLYELASGRPAMRGEDLFEIMRAQVEYEPPRLGALRSGISPFFEEVVATLLEKAPDERPGSAGDLLELLDQGEQSSWWRERAARVPKARSWHRVPRETAMQGREAAVEHLQAAYTRAAQGRGEVLLIEGEAGIGKSRLLDEWLSAVVTEPEAPVVLLGGAEASRDGGAVGAFRQAVGEFDKGEDEGAFVARMLEKTPRLVSAFQAHIAGDAAGKDDAALDAGSLGGCYEAVLRGLAARGPVVWIVEDLHNADEPTRALFLRLARRAADLPVLLVGSARHGLPDPWLADLARLERTDRLALDRLGPRELARLMSEFFGSERLVEELGWSIAQKSDGNPFFAFEILRSLQEQGVLRRGESGEWITTERLADIRIPSSLSDLVGARLAQLREEEQELLDVAACQGTRFDGAVVAEVLDRRLIGVLRVLGRLEREHRLVRAAGDRFEFDHDQLRQVVYERMSPALRAAYHAAIGRVLLDSDPDPDRRTVFRICLHLLRGRDGKRALPMLERAAQSLVAMAQVKEATSLLDMALELDDLPEGPERAKLTSLRGDFRRRQGDIEGSNEDFAAAGEMARTFEDDQLLLRLYGYRVIAMERDGAFHDALELIRTMQTHAERLGEVPPMSLVLSLEGRILWSLGRLDEAEAVLRRSLDVLGDLDSPRERAHAESTMGLVYARRGDLEQALRHFRVWHEMALAQGGGGHEIPALGAQGKALVRLGRFEEAEAIVETWVERARECGDRSFLVTALANQVELFVMLGRLGEAYATAERQYALAMDLSYTSAALGATRALADLEGLLGDAATARDLLLPVEETAMAAENRMERATWWRSQASMEFLLGDARAAFATSNKAVALLRELGMRDTLPEALAGHVRLALDLEDAEGARAAAQELVDLGTADDQPGARLVGLSALALLGADAGEDLRAAFLASRRRTSNASQLQTCWQMWLATHVREWLDDARAIVEARLDSVPEERREAMRSRVPFHAQVLDA